eukprot:jgi/Botrbrau1/7363/Bobra.0316s0010.1
MCRTLGQPTGEPDYSASHGARYPDGRSRMHGFNPVSSRRAVSFHPSSFYGAPASENKRALHVSFGPSVLGSGLQQVPYGQLPAVSTYLGSAPMVSNVSGVSNAAPVNAATTVVYAPSAPGGMIPLNLPTTTLRQLTNPSMVHSCVLQAPQTQGMHMAAYALLRGGPPGGGPPYSEGPPGGVGGAWHPPPNTRGPPQFPFYGGGNPSGAGGGGGPRDDGSPGGPHGPGGGGGGGAGPPFGWVPPISAGQGPPRGSGFPGVPIKQPNTVPTFSSQQILAFKFRRES